MHGRLGAVEGMPLGGKRWCAKNARSPLRFARALMLRARA
jgi:hypothetical protein